ncbi:MAG: TIGR03619 family F420-dependent LLM class oxidoreductase [Acidimicrobiales bacterium]|nr:TIGR03619 family F420-dependent LLM class oxidoreductase [Acidimicrobiales bacterium]
MVRLGVAYPQSALGGSPEALRSFACAVEDAGFTHLALYDHILGADRQAWPDLTGPWRAEHEFHDAFVALAFVAASTSAIELTVQVLVMPQRQIAATARQAASVAQLSNGRMRLGIGAGWNPVEYQALGVDFHDRGEVLDEQLPIFQRLLTGEIVSSKGRWHTLDHVALNPVPAQPIPLWFGGTVSKTFQRVADFGQGWITLYDRPGETVARRLKRLHGRAAAAGRDPEGLGLDVWLSMGGTGPSQWRQEVEGWLAHGVTHLTLNTGFEALHHHPIEGTSIEAHLDAVRTFRDTVGDLL